MGHWRGYLQVEDFHPCPCDCRVGSQSRGGSRFQPPLEDSVRRAYPRHGFKRQAPLTSRRGLPQGRRGKGSPRHGPARLPRLLLSCTTMPDAGNCRRWVRPQPASPPLAPGGPPSVRVVMSRTSWIADFICQSGGLPAPSRHPPVIDAVPDIHGIFVPALPAFRTFPCCIL